jgi:DNA-binding FrmR family transcriptional regulator
MNHDSTETIRRLKTAEGHLRGIQRMLEEDAYCIDVIRQIQAVQSALNKVSAQILDRHVNSCLISAIQGDDPAERERVLKEIVAVFSGNQTTSALAGVSQSNSIPTGETKS